MFDTLTLDELYDLHAKLSAEYHAIHARMMNGQRALIPVMGDEWKLLGAKSDEIAETADAAYAEITRREQEANADA